MKKTVAVLLFVVLFVASIKLIGRKMSQDSPSLTTRYSTETSVYVPPSATMVNKFEAGGAALAVVGMTEFKKTASSPGQKNFMSTSRLEGSCTCTSPMVKLDYYSLSLANGTRFVVTASQEVSFVAGRSLEWGRFASDGTFSLDQERGTLRFPLNYERGNAKLWLLWAVSLVLSAFLCWAISFLAFRFISNFDPRAVMARIKEGHKARTTRDATGKPTIQATEMN
jgi:hypothetical protein